MCLGFDPWPALPRHNTVFLGGVGSVVFMVLSDGDQNIWEVYKIKGFIRICAESVILSCLRF